MPTWAPYSVNEDSVNRPTMSAALDIFLLYSSNSSRVHRPTISGVIGIPIAASMGPYGANSGRVNIVGNESRVSS